MKCIVVKRFTLASIAAVTVCAASTFTAQAAVDITVSDVLAVAAKTSVPVPIQVPELNETSITPEVVVGSSTVALPEPGTAVAGLAILAYCLLKPARRTRA
jgi:hypothetical protein